MHLPILIVKGKLFSFQYSIGEMVFLIKFWQWEYVLIYLLDIPYLSKEWDATNNFVKIHFLITQYVHGIVFRLSFFSNFLLAKTVILVWLSRMIHIDGIWPYRLVEIKRTLH